MSWLIVLVAGILEVVWACSLNYASTPLHWIGIVIIIALSYSLLIIAYKRIPVAIAYGVYVGIGTVGTYVGGLFLGDSFSLVQAIAILAVLLGIIGLKVFTNDNEIIKGEK